MFGRRGVALLRPAELGAGLWGGEGEQFGGQDPGSNEEIASFCQLNYGVSFPMMAKIDVNGDKAHPLYQWLVKEAPGILGTKAIKWNFTKFLIDRQGHVVERFAPTTEPEEMAPAIEKML